MEKELNRKTIFEGKIFTVTHEEVLCENEEHAFREVVYHHGGVSILAIKDNQIILVKQFRYPNRIETLEIPAGKLEENEDPKDCAFRELEEETNLRAKDMKLITRFMPTPAYSSEWISIYEAIDFHEVKDALEGDPDEFIDIITMDIEEAYHKVIDGSIVDAKTIIAIMYAYNQRITQK